MRQALVRGLRGNIKCFAVVPSHQIKTNTEKKRGLIKPFRFVPRCPALPPRRAHDPGPVQVTTTSEVITTDDDIPFTYNDDGSEYHTSVKSCYLLFPTRGKC